MSYLRLLASNTPCCAGSTGMRASCYRKPLHRARARAAPPRAQVVKTGDVIEFYNAVFIPAVKAFVLRLGSGKAALVRPPALSVPSTPSRAGVFGGAHAHHLFGTPPAAERGAAALGAPNSAAAAAKFVSPGRGCQVFISPLRQSLQQARFMPQPRTIRPLLHVAGPQGALQAPTCYR